MLFLLSLVVVATFGSRFAVEESVGDRAECMDLFTRVVGLSHDEAVDKCGPDPNATKAPVKHAINDCCTVHRSSNEASCAVKGNDRGCGRKLKLGEGDCDSHCDCGFGLMCGHNNCPWGDGDDCCRSMTEHEIKFVIKDCPGEQLAFAQTTASTTSDELVTYGFAAVGASFLLFGAFRYYTRKGDLVTVEMV